MPYMIDVSLEPLDRIYVAIVRQAIADYLAGKEQRRHTGAAYSYWDARAFLLDCGLLDDAGDVAVTDRTAL